MIFGDELLILSANGVASIVVFRNDAPGLLKLVPDQEESAVDFAIQKVAKTVIDEVKTINISKKQYNARLTDNNIQEYVSETLLSFLSKLSSKLDHSPHAYLPGNWVYCYKHYNQLSYDDADNTRRFDAKF